MNFKIAIGGLHIESSTFTNYRSGEKDFLIRRGLEMLEMYPWISKYNDEIKFLPTIHGRALPGGMVSKEFFFNFFAEFKQRLMDLKDLNIDGFIFDIHGAMSVEGIFDAEGYMLKEIRKIIGPDVVVSTSMDLHGSVSDDLFEASDLITCYRTAPHIDALQTRERTFDNLITVLKRGKRGFVKSKVDVPILLSGEKTSTEVEPGKTLYKKIDNIINNENILDASIWMGFPWADEPRCHASVVVTGYDEEIVTSEAAKLGEYFWSLRDGFEFVGPTSSVTDAVKMSLAFDFKPFFISDTGDNPGAGGSGDSTVILNAFLNHLKTNESNKKILFSSLVDSESIKLIYEKKIGEKLNISLGGKIDPHYSGPSEIEVVVKNFFSLLVAGKSAVVSVGNIDIIVTEKRFQYGFLKYFNESGIKSFDEYDIIVVKMGYLQPDLSNAAKGWVMALSEGAVNQDLMSMTFENLISPLFPFDGGNFAPNLKPYTVKYKK